MNSQIGEESHDLKQSYQQAQNQLYDERVS